MVGKAKEVAGALTGRDALPEEGQLAGWYSSESSAPSTRQPVAC
jgi:hypothetical protein